MARDRFREFQQASGTPSQPATVITFGSSHESPPRYNDSYNAHHVQSSPHSNTFDLDSSIELSRIQVADDIDFLTKINSIDDSIKKLNAYTEEMKTFHSRALITTSTDEAQRLSDKLDRTVGKLNSLANEIKNKIKSIEEDISNMPPQSSERRLQLGQHRTVSSRFLAAMENFKSVQLNYQEKYRDRIRRQFRIVRPEATAEEIAEVVENTDEGPILSNKMFQMQLYYEAKVALQEVEDRHRDIVNIEKSIIELTRLFNDMALMIAKDDELIQNIEDQVKATEEHTVRATTEMARAIKSAKSFRKKKWFIIICVIILAVVIGIIIWQAIEAGHK